MKIKIYKYQQLIKLLLKELVEKIFGKALANFDLLFFINKSYIYYTINNISKNLNF
jgi:hypothetical protein